MTMLAPAHATGRGPTDRLPDLRMITPQDVRVIRYHGGQLSGHRLLRFTTIITNEGRGPLELRGKRTCVSLRACPTMSVRQRIKRSDGSWRSIPTTATMRYEVGDGHHHWHAVGLEGYQLWQLGVADPTPLRAAKYGFCFFDGRRWLPGSPTRARYHESGPRSATGCGDPTSRSIRVGLTRGWADIYPWNFARQYIDITGVPKGEYLLCVTADPSKQFRQTRTNNDEAWLRLRIAGTRLTIRDSQRSSCEAERARFAPDPDALD